LSRATGAALLLACLAGWPLAAQTAAPVANAAPASKALPTAHERDQAQEAYVEGAKAIEKHDLPRAAERFERATRLDPTNQDYATALVIARQNLVTQLIQQAEKAKLRGDEKEWRATLTEAVRLDALSSTHNPMVAAHVGDLAERVTPEEPVLAGGSNDAGPLVELQPKAVAPQSFHLYATRDQVARKVYEAFGITVFIDKSIAPSAPEDTRVRFDQDDVTFAQAEQAMMLATNTFAVPLDPQRALVALDTKANRTAYERLGQETVYLPGLTSTELTDVSSIAKTIFEAQQASVDEGAHTVVVRAPASKLKPLNLMLTELLAGRSEVTLDVHVYEITRTRDVTEGAELPSSSNIFNVTSEVNSLIAANPTLVQEIISSGLATPGNIEEIAAALVLSGMAGSTLLSQPFAYFGGGITTTGVTLGQSAANATLNVTDTRMLDQVQLRLLDQEEGTVRVGERYPIVTSSYSNLATSSTSIAGISTAGLSSTLASLGVSLSSLQSSAAATVPQVQYQDLGLTLHATSRVQQERDISLKVDLQLSSLNGASLNGNPVLNNRQYQSIITLKPGEKALVVSSLNTQESAALLGLPFLSEIPGFRLGTNETIMKTRDSLVIVITPRLVRMSHRTSAGTLVLLPQHS
jgi:Flp pilus assembly secretin CpaC